VNLFPFHVFFCAPLYPPLLWSSFPWGIENNFAALPPVPLPSGAASLQSRPLLHSGESLSEGGFVLSPHPPDRTEAAPPRPRAAVRGVSRRNLPFLVLSLPSPNIFFPSLCFNETEPNLFCPRDNDDSVHPSVFWVCCSFSFFFQSPFSGLFPPLQRSRALPRPSTLTSPSPRQVPVVKRCPSLLFFLPIEPLPTNALFPTLPTPHPPPHRSNHCLSPKDVLLSGLFPSLY